MATKTTLVISTSLYFAVASIILCSAYVSWELTTLSASSIPVLLSILILIPLYLWLRTYQSKNELSKQVDKISVETVMFRIVSLYGLAMVIRIPSVLLLNEPYEKTPLIFLLVLTMVLIEKTDVSAYGFRTRKMAKSLLYGLILYAILGVLTMIISYSMIGLFINQMPVQAFDFAPFLATMPFMTLCVGISEEGLFRGYMQTRLSRITSFKLAIVIQAILFGVWHFVWRISPLDLAGMAQYIMATFIFGLLFGYFYHKSQNLTPLIFAHGLWNSVQYGIRTNPEADAALMSLPLTNQVFLSIFPYALCAVLTLIFIKYAVREI